MVLRNRHTLLLKPALICVAILAVYVFVLGKAEADRAWFVVRFVSMVFGAQVVVQAVLHVKYLLDNSRYIVESEPGRITVQRRIHNSPIASTKLVITPDTVASVTLFGVPAVVEDRTRWLPWDEYYYWVIVCESGERIIINSLLIDDISSLLPTPATINHRRVKLFCWPP